jgi:hypothetical protein
MIAVAAFCHSKVEGPRFGSSRLTAHPLIRLNSYQYVKTNKANDNDWFRLESNKEGTR